MDIGFQPMVFSTINLPHGIGPAPSRLKAADASRERSVSTL
jgi:hypothetical protein